MIWLLDSDICSAHIRGEQAVMQQVRASVGQVAVSTITEGELLTWCLRRSAPQHRLRAVENFLADVSILPVDNSVSRRFAQLHALLLDTGRRTQVPDLFVAATAVEHGLTMVTHNTRHFVNIPGIALEDWLAP